MTDPSTKWRGPPSDADHSEHPRTVVYWKNTLGARKAPSRGQKHHPLLRIQEEIPWRSRAALLVIGLAIPFGLWAALAHSNGGSIVVPSPAQTWGGAKRLWHEGVLGGDLWASCRRILIAYAISMAVAVVIGLLMGTFRSFDSFMEPPIGFMRYVPATALIPLLLTWQGIDELPKITMIVLGSVFFNILMVADVARTVPRDMVNASYTLGAGRITVLRRVILPHSVPGIIDVARINLAAAWSILVVAELLAAESGLAFRITRAQRFRQVDETFAILIIFGIIGVGSDLFLRSLRRRAAPWAVGT